MALPMTQIVDPSNMAVVNVGGGRAIFGGNVYPNLREANAAKKSYLAEQTRASVMSQQAVEQMKTQTQSQQWALKQAQEAWNLQKQQADASGKMAAQFLDAWGGSVNELKSMFGDIGNVLKGVMSGDAFKGGGVYSEISNLANQMKAEYDQYKAEYAPIEKEFMSHARDLAQGQRNILTELAEGGPGRFADIEGAASRAGKDVSLQAEIQNQAQARELMSMGIDPSSGKFGALTRKSAVDTAGETARAMNIARNMEKSAGLERGIAVAGAIDPHSYARTAMDIREKGSNLLTGAGVLHQAGAQARASEIASITGVANTYGNLAGHYSEAITKPLSEMAGYWTGMAGGGGGAVTPPKPQPVGMNYSGYANIR